MANTTGVADHKATGPAIPGLTVERTKAIILLIVQLFSVAQTGLSIAGISQLPFTTDQVSTAITGVIAVIASVYAWWRNNNLTGAAVQGQLRRPTRCPTPGEPTRPLTWHPSRRCPMATASEVLRIAAGEIGYSRWTDPQPGTKYGRWYAQSHGSYYGASGVPFCAMFVSWVMSRAGQAFPGLPAAYVPYVLSAGRSRAVSTRSAKPGDIVIFNWDGGVVDHIGFVEANHGSYIQTIEGNTNNGRVARRTRAWNTIAAILRPAYSGSATSSGGGTASSGGTGRLTVDGSCGPATIRRWQQVMGTSVDGIISGQYRPDGRTWGRPALVDSCVRYGGGGSNLIRAVQRKLSLTADGLLGPATIRALQKHLGVAQDSWFGPGTARALQSRLNTGRF